MPIEIKRVESRKQFNSFIDFPLKLYKDMPAFVPALRMDDVDTLDPKKNPAYKFCDAAMFLAYRDGELAGRVCAIVNRSANDKWDHQEVRFGWLDFVDDKEVSAALLQAVTDFGKERGMTTITGPLGFTDFDPEGMLVEGYECLSTMALHHNWPYYKDHMEALGYEKEVDWLEYKIYLPDELPEKYDRVRKIVEEKYGLHVRQLTRSAIRKEGLGYRIFDLVNETYSQLYNFTILPKEMIDKYVSFYMGVLDPKFLNMVEDSEGNPVAFGFTMPSITRALQKCKGRLFPFGWYHILKSMFFKYEENVELLLIGIKPEYRNKGVNALIFSDLLPKYHKAGFKYAETNAELEYNHSVQALWGDFEVEQKKRRRVYKKSI